MPMYKIYQFKKEYYPSLNPVVIGEYEEERDHGGSEILAENIWCLCNSLDFMDDIECLESIKYNGITFYPSTDFIGHCSNDIVVETKDGLYMTESFGWRKVESVSEAIKAIKL